MKARARIELREEATEQDVRDVIEIMKYRQAFSVVYERMQPNY